MLDEALFAAIDEIVWEAEHAEMQPEPLQMLPSTCLMSPQSDPMLSNATNGKLNFNFYFMS